MFFIIASPRNKINIYYSCIFYAIFYNDLLIILCL